MKRSIILSALIISAGYYHLFSEVVAQSEILPFRLVGKLICIEASVENQAGLFILDTGYKGILLNSRYFTGRRSNDLLYSAKGEGVGVHTQYVDLTLTPTLTKRVYADIGNLGSLENQKGIAILGLIGSSFFADYELTFDYANHAIFLYEPDRKDEMSTGSPLNAPPTLVLKCTFKGHLPCVEAQIGDLTLRLGIDSGAESNLLMPKIHHNLTSHLQERSSIKIQGLDQQLVETLTGNLTGVKVGNIPYSPMKTVSFDITRLNLELVGPKLDGMLGYEFLRQYKTAINFRKKEVYIWIMEKNLARN